MSARSKVPSKVIAAVVAGLLVVSLAALIGYRWLLANFVKPEAGLSSLSVIASADGETLGFLGIRFPEVDGIPIALSSAQLEKLSRLYAPPGATISLTNHYGFPYEVSVSRSRDMSSPSGVHYRWLFRDVGADGKSETEDDITAPQSNRPLVDRPK